MEYQKVSDKRRKETRRENKLNDYNTTQKKTQ
jgi:hypothetical protein